MGTPSSSDGRLHRVWSCETKCPCETLVVCLLETRGGSRSKHLKGSEVWVNNCWWGWQNRTDPRKCTHLYDETQGTVKHKRIRQKIVFVNCKKIDNKIYLCIYLCICVSIYLSLYLREKIDNKIYLYIYVSISLYICLSIYLLTPDEDNYLSKALVFHCSLCFVV